MVEYGYYKYITKNPCYYFSRQPSFLFNLAIEKKRFLLNDLEARFKQFVKKILRELEIMTSSLECEKDLSQIVLNAPQTQGPADMKIKGVTFKS